MSFWMVHIHLWSSISSWHMLLKYSHELLILVLMVLTSIKVFTASNISDFKFIISVFFQRYILCWICCWYLTYTLDSMYYISWSLTPLIGLHVVARDGMFAAKISSIFCLLVGKFITYSRSSSSMVDLSSLFIPFLYWFPVMVYSCQSISGKFIWCSWGIYCRYW